VVPTTRFPLHEWHLLTLCCSTTCVVVHASTCVDIALRACAMVLWIWYGRMMATASSEGKCCSAPSTPNQYLKVFLACVAVIILSYYSMLRVDAGGCCCGVKYFGMLIQFLLLFSFSFLPHPLRTQTHTTLTSIKRYDHLREGILNLTSLFRTSILS
jgi:hypothetical protein